MIGLALLKELRSQEKDKLFFNPTLQLESIVGEDKREGNIH